MSLFETPQNSLNFPQSLAEKYRPRSINDFVGLEKIRRVFSRFVEKPYSSAWLFTGPSGTGKTSFALAVCEAVSGELIHIPSQRLPVDELANALRMTSYVPMAGKKFWVVLIDEIDAPTSRAAHLALLSRLDATGFPQNTIFFFTSNGTENLEPRLLSRMRRLDFTSYGLAEPASKLLAEIWQREAGNAEAPNFGQIARDARNNIRDCLMRLETEILAA